MTDDLSLARNVIAKAEIVSVRLIASNTKATIRAPQQAGNAPVRLKQEFSTTRTDKGFRVLGDFGAAILTQDANAPPAVLLEATFELEYTLPSDLNASDEELNAFARLNGLFNAWPYFREFVQASMARMQLPPLVLPLMRVRSTALVGAKPAEKPLGPGDISQPSLAPPPVNPEVKKEST